MTRLSVQTMLMAQLMRLLGGEEDEEEREEGDEEVEAIKVCFCQLFWGEQPVLQCFLFSRACSSCCCRSCP